MISARVMSLLEDWDFREVSNSNEKHNAFYAALARVVAAAEKIEERDVDDPFTQALWDALRELEAALKGVGV